MNNLNSALFIFAIFIIGLLIEIFPHYLHKSKLAIKYKTTHFKFAHYLSFLLFPMAAIFLTIYFNSLNIIPYMLAFAVFGTLMEWFIGFSYHKIVGQRLWTYHRYSIQGYTSLLSIPLWGLAGALFWSLNTILK